MATSEDSGKVASHTTSHTGLSDKESQLTAVSGVTNLTSGNTAGTYLFDATPNGDVQVRVTPARELDTLRRLENLDEASEAHTLTCNVTGQEEQGETRVVLPGNLRTNADMYPDTEGHSEWPGNVACKRHRQDTHKAPLGVLADVSSRVRGQSRWTAQVTSIETPEESCTMPSRLLSDRLGSLPVREVVQGGYMLDQRSRSGVPINQAGNSIRQPDASYNGGSENMLDAGLPPRSESNGRMISLHHRKTATYDGSTKWRDFFVYFELAAELNQWDDRQKALELATSLRGVALGILGDIEPELRISYRHLVAALGDRFAPCNQTELYRTQLKNRVREKDETVTELAQNVKQTARLAYPDVPPHVRERLARDCFMDALNDPELEWIVFQGKPVSVEDAVRIALEYEAFQAGHKKHPESKIRMQRNAGDEGVTMSLIESALTNFSKRLTKIENQMKSVSDSPKRSGKCRYCGESGHWRRDCGKRQARLASQGD